jgi:hypothetical protein
MKEDHFKILLEWAVSLWGADRADALRPALQSTAQELEQIISYPMDPQLEPIFFL